MNEQELKPLVTDELVIAGCRHGDMSDKLTLPSATEDLIEAEDIRRTIGSDIVYLKRTPNYHDQYAIGVYSSSKKRLGFLWVNQSYAMYEWMLSHKVESVKARICRVSKRYGFMISKPLKPMKLTIRPSENLFVNTDWANDVPMVQHCKMVDELNLNMIMLEDALAENDCWNEDLKQLIEDVIESLPYDLSTLNVIRGVRLYLMMKDAKIREVRDESDRLLYTMIHRGSPERMKWWTDNCLTNYFNDASEGSLLRMYECANFTLAQVEALLHQAPAQLFHYYLADRDHFATHLLYAGLPYELYVRLLTLLAVREAMIKGAGKTQTNKEVVKDKKGCFRFESDFFKERMAAVVRKFYDGSHASLALIETTLYYHGQLSKRNAHKPVLMKLIEWGILDKISEKEMMKITNAMSFKLSSLPPYGYMEWNEPDLLNYKKICMEIGEELGPTMPYNAKMR